MLRCFAGLLFLSGIAAQTEVWRNVSVQCSYWFDYRQFALRDLDGDGHEEIASPVATFSNCREQSAVWTWSGRTGSRIGLPLSLPVFLVHALGDVDRDGFLDYLGAPLHGTSWDAHNGRNGQILWSFQDVGRVLGEVDANGDGTPDCVIASPRANNDGGWFQVREGRSGTLLYRFDGINGVIQVGSSLGRVGDLDGDGADDFVVGCSWIAAAQTDAAVVISGRRGVPIQFGFGDRTTALASYQVSGAGDVDRDGLPDFAGSGGGGALIFTGRTGATLHRIRGPFGGNFGVSLTGGEDLDQDGCGDILVGTFWDSGGLRPRVEAISGRDGTIMWEIAATNGATGSGLGVPGSFRMLRAQPGSHFPMVVTCEPAVYYGSGCCDRWGALRMFRASPPGVEAYGAPCAPNTPTPPRIGVRALNSRARVTVVDAPAGGIGVLLLGTSRTKYGGLPLPLPLDAFGLVGCQLLTSIEISRPVPLGTAGVDRGYAAIDVPVNLFPPGIGTRNIYAQWVVIDTARPALVGVTQALSLTVR